MTNIVTLDNFIKKSVDKLKSFGDIDIPDPRDGGALYQEFPEAQSPSPHYIYFNCQPFGDYIRGISKIGNLRYSSRELRPSGIKINFSMRPNCKIMDEEFEKDKKRIPYKWMSSNQALSEIILDRMYDFGPNYGIRLFGESSGFFGEFYEMLRQHPISQKYEIKDLGNGRTFMIGSSDVHKSKEADNQIVVWGQKDCLNFVNDLAEIVRTNKIPAHFGHSKNWSGPADNHLVGAFYDPNWKK